MGTKRIGWIGILLSLAVGGGARAEPGARQRAPWLLAPGEQRRLRLPGLTRYSQGGGSIKIMPLSKVLQVQDELLIKAVSPGHADLWLWSKSGPPERQPIEVAKATAPALAPALARAVSQLEEAEVLLSGEGIVVRGEVRSVREAARIGALVRGFPQGVRDETEPTEALLDEQQTQLTEWIRKAGLGDQLRVDRQGPLLGVIGSLPKAADRERADRALRALSPWVTLEIKALPDDSPVIHFQVFLLELRKTRLGSLGLTWPASQEAAFRLTSGGLRQAVDLPVTLKALESEGSARVLSNPELAVRAPGEAELFAGGELPIRTTSQYSSQVSWRNFGLLLKLKVAQATATQARLEIQTEVSHLDPDLDRDDLPGIQANRIHTQVDAEFGRPLFLSGMLQQDLRRQAKGLPFLRRIPVLGLLFGSEDYLNDRSELVAVLLPQARPPRPPMERFHRITARGKAPAPRNWIDPRDEQKLRAQADYPWNAFR